MLNELRNESNMTLTENGAVTYSSTGSDCLDLFATAGALRKAHETEIINRFIRAYAEDKDIAMKLLFFTRDVRGGLGERRVFRTIFKWLANNYPESVKKNLEYVSEFGRFDDLLSLMNTKCEKDMLNILNKQFCEDLKALENGGNVSLLAKWLPSVNATNKDTVYSANRIAKAFGMKNSEYRKALSKLRAQIRIIENNLREKDYSFDYEKQPSRAMFKYRAAFMRNDTERYTSFLNRVTSGNAVLHADNVSPYELVDRYLTTGRYGNHRSFLKDVSEEEAKVLNATWDSLPDYGLAENAIAVVDTSGSMYCQSNPSPASVALSLGLYFAEHNHGAFANHFIEFSNRPQLIELKGSTFVDRLRYIASFNKIADTNLEAVFDLILNAAIRNHVPQEELPAKLVIISDMEFNSCVRNAGLTNFENARKNYEFHGYKLPEIVFWNVASRNRQQPVRVNEQGAALVSGATPRLFEMIAGGNLSPYKLMMDTLSKERYAKIVA